MKNWIIRKTDEKTANDIAQNGGISPLCAEILNARGFDTFEKVRDFFETDILENPFIIKDMQKAADIINNAVDEYKNICIYGDYDCDGITATVILYSYLQCMGANVTYYIPERDEGYGMNKSAIKTLLERGTELIITVDNGISAVEEAEYIKELGMELIITDHHQPGEILPEALAIVNPHRIDCDSRFKELCGAGIAMKLVAALDGGDYEMTAIDEFSPLAALGTVADVVTLTGENRFIVKQGLEMITVTEQCGLLALIKSAGLENKPLTSTSLAFGLAPRINAAGRFGSPSLAVKLLLCDDPDEADAIAEQLEELNNERKKAEDNIVLQISDIMKKDISTLNERVLIFSGENWHHGVIGIVASRMLERFGKPCFMITIEDDTARGSIRSFEGFNVFKCLEYCSDILIKFGGHAGAGGFSIETSRIDELKKRILLYTAQNHDIMPAYNIYADKLIMPEEITIDNINSLAILEPFGEGCRQPLFFINGAIIENAVPLSNDSHVSLMLRYGKVLIKALLFRTRLSDMGINKGDVFDFIVSLENNTYQGKTNTVLFIKDYKKHGVKLSACFAANTAYEKFIRNEKLPEKYIEKLCPERNELVSFYTSIPKDGIQLSSLFTILSDKINYGKLRACTDIMSELGLVNYDAFNQRLKLIRVTKKADLESSALLRRLRNSHE